MSYQLDFKTHHELVDVLYPTLQENSSPPLSIPEARMAASAVIDVLVPKICEIVDREMEVTARRIALATGRG